MPAQYQFGDSAAEICDAMMKAANTAGTLINLKNWSKESIAIIPQDNVADLALVHDLRGPLIADEKLVGNGCSAHREQRQNRNNH